MTVVFPFFSRTNQSFANCGLPYYIGDVIPKAESLIIASSKLFRDRFNVDVRVLHEVIEIDKASKSLQVRNVQTNATYTVIFGIGACSFSLIFDLLGTL